MSEIAGFSSYFRLARHSGRQFPGVRMPHIWFPTYYESGLVATRALLMQETTKSGLARVCTFDLKTGSANVKVEIEDRGSAGFVIRRATVRSLRFAILQHHQGVYGRHVRTSYCA